MTTMLVARPIWRDARGAHARPARALRRLRRRPAPAGVAADVAARVGPGPHRQLRGAVAAARRSTARPPIDAAPRRPLRRVRAPPLGAAVAADPRPGRGARLPRARCAASVLDAARPRLDLRRRVDPLLARRLRLRHGPAARAPARRDDARHPPAAWRAARRRAPSGAGRARPPTRADGRPGRRPRSRSSTAGRSSMGTDDRPVGLRQRASGARGRASRRSASTRTPVTNARYARVRRRRRLRRPARCGPTAAGRGASEAGLAHPQFWRREGDGDVERPALRPSARPRRPPRRAGAARLLVRGRRLRPLGRQAAADRGRVGEGGDVGSRHGRQAALPVGRRRRRRPSAPTSASARDGPDPVGAHPAGASPCGRASA